MALPPAALVPLMLIPSVAPFEFPHADDLYHVIGFSLLVLPYAIWARARLLPGILFLFLFGCTIEVLQPLFGRDAEWSDIGANAIGLMAGAGLGFVLHRLLRRRRVA